MLSVGVAAICILIEALHLLFKVLLTRHNKIEPVKVRRSALADQARPDSHPVCHQASLDVALAVVLLVVLWNWIVAWAFAFRFEYYVPFRPLILVSQSVKLCLPLRKLRLHWR